MTARTATIEFTPTKWNPGDRIIPRAELAAPPFTEGAPA